MTIPSKSQFLNHGILIVDKIAGITSHDIIKRLRKTFNPIKLGHSGTLDPFATGVLVLVFNQATCLSEILGKGNKIYQATLKLGQATNTGDYTGKIIKKGPIIKPNFNDSLAAVKSLKNITQQIPPDFSAVKYRGQPLYSYARAGIKVNKTPRPITIYKTELKNIGHNWIEFNITCSRGTYIRGVAEELASTLGTVGHLSALRRLASLPFTINQSFSLNTILNWNNEKLYSQLLSLPQALNLCKIPSTVLDEKKIKQIQYGHIPTQQLLRSNQNNNTTENIFMVLSPNGNLAAILQKLNYDKYKNNQSYKIIKNFSI